MTDQTQPPAEAGKAPEGAETPLSRYTPEQTETYIKQLRDEAKQHRLAAEATAAKLLEEQRKAEETRAEQLKEQGKFKELYESASTELAKQKAEFEKLSPYKPAFQAILDAQVKAVPENMRTLVPDGLDAIQLSAWLNKNAALLTNRQAPDLNAGEGNSAKPPAAVTLTPDQIIMAEASGMTPEQYMTALAKTRKK